MLIIILGVPEVRTIVGRQLELSSLGYGIFTTNAASNIAGLPNELGEHRAMIIKAPYDTSSYATTVIDIEGNIGVYTSTGSGTWSKQ